jgi:catechol 2,3-dioxygenase-like lactoylglutathione lyase family enzyme
MESVIDGLLKDFENGRLTRRQLIRSLAMAALAAPAAAHAQAPAATAKATSPWKTTALDHISYAVADYKKSVAFYSELMGWEVRNDNGTNQCTMGIGSIGEIIIRNRRDPPAADAREGRPPLTGVINHISWGVDPWNTDSVKAELERRGLKPRPDMQGNDFKSFHVLDPDGWDLQISNQNGKKS